MSYYNNPYFTHPHGHRQGAFGYPHHPSSYPHPHGFEFAGRHPTPPFGNYGLGHPFHDTDRPIPPTVHFETPATATETNVNIDIDEEERAALAHLRSIQQRKESAAAAQAKAKSEVEAKIRAEIEAKVKAQYEAQAIRKTIEKEQKRKAASLAARKEYERQISATIASRAEAQSQAQAQARAEAQQELQAQQQFVARIHARQAHSEAVARAHAQREAEAERQSAIAHQLVERKKAMIAAYREDKARKVEELKQRYAGTRCTRPAQPSAQTQPESQSARQEGQKFDPTQLNPILRLFGINIVPDSDTQSTPTPGPASVPVQPSQTETPAPAQESNVIPREVNDLLSHFLGLRIEPASADEAKSAGTQTTQPEGGNAVPQGLNEFLSRFGLVFEPETGNTNTDAQQDAPAPVPEVKVTPVTSVAAPIVPAPAPAPVQPTPVQPTPTPAQAHSKRGAPFTNFFGQHANIPPFLRDILEQAEEAILEDVLERSKSDIGGGVEGKGKGVADGEKKASGSGSKSPVAPTAAPAPAAATSQDPQPETANGPELKLNQIDYQLLELQSNFTFPPSLSFSPDSTSPTLLFNRQNSTYHHQANSLLQLLLALDGINGDKSIRVRRRELVKKVEEELQNLERGRDEIWEKVKDHVQHQVEDVHSDSESSDDGVVIDKKEVVPEVKAVPAATEVEGYQLDTTAPATAPAPEPVAETITQSEVVPSAVEPQTEPEVSSTDVISETEIKDSDPVDQSEVNSAQHSETGVEVKKDTRPKVETVPDVEAGGKDKGNESDGYELL